MLGGQRLQSATIGLKEGKIYIMEALVIASDAVRQTMNPERLKDFSVSVEAENIAIDREDPSVEISSDIPEALQKKCRYFGRMGAHYFLVKQGDRPVQLIVRALDKMHKDNPLQKTTRTALI